MSELSLKRRRSGAISGSERITGVKNAQADMLLSRKKLHYDVLLKKTEQDIQLEEHRWENEGKLLNLENKRNDLEYKRRLYPEADHSNDEMTVRNLEKYLVRNANKLCYTDKSLQNKVRNNCSTDTVPPVVAKARASIVRKEIIKAVEKNRKHMYKFLDKPVSRQHKREQQLYGSTHSLHIHPEEDEFNVAVRENKLPSFSGHLMPEVHLQTGKLSPEKHHHQDKQNHSKGKQFLSLPAVPEHPLKKSAKQKQQPRTLEVPHPVRVVDYEKRELRARLKQNPLVQEALEAHEREKNTLDPTKSKQCVTEVLARMAKKKPPTRTEIQAELDSVQEQVGDFCERIEQLLWAYKEEEFQQSLKFVKDKDAEWNKFMETMQERKRNAKEDDKYDSEDDRDDMSPTQAEIAALRKRRPNTSALSNMPTFSEKQKEKIIMKNLLLNRPRLVESAPTRKRGVPHYAEERSQHHSPTAKLQRMLEKNNKILESVAKAGQTQEKPDAAASQLTVANKMAAVTAK